MEATDENEELRRFREDWKREVAARKRADTVLSSSSLSSTTNDQLPTASESGLVSEPPYDDRPPAWPSNLASAVEMYAEAVAFEEQGLLDAATQLYKRAFVVDSNVHKAYGQALKSTLEQGKIVDDLPKPVQKLNVAKSRRKLAHLSNFALPDAKGLSFMPPPRLPPSPDAAIH